MGPNFPWFFSLFLFFSLTSITIVAAETTTFDQLNTSFEKSDAPPTKEMDGYWAGRCVNHAAPNDLRAGLFIHRRVKDEQEFPPIRLTFSYYWHKEWAPETFDKWNNDQISASPELSEWFAKEQWQKLTYQGNSMVNYYNPSENLSFKREVRFFRDEFNDLILLRVTRIDDGEAETDTLCYFRHKIASHEEIATAYSIKIRNLTASDVRYTFRFGENYQWSQQTVESSAIHAWSQTVLKGNPIIRFDSSYFPGYQMKQYAIGSGEYAFVRDGFGLDLIKEGSLRH